MQNSTERAARMTTKQAENRVGLTSRQVTGLSWTDDTGLTSEGVRGITPSIKTTRRYKPRTRKCKCGCGQMVTPTAQAPYKVFFNDTCRKRWHRRQEAKMRPIQPPADPVLELTVCQYCGDPFLAEVGKGAKYCKPSHRVAAAEHRRDAAVEPLMASMPDLTPVQAKDMVQGVGMKLVTRYLLQQGYVYNEQSRRWAVLVEQGDVFAQAE